MTDSITYILKRGESRLSGLSQRVERLKDDVECLTVRYRRCDDQIGRNRDDRIHRNAG